MRIVEKSGVERLKKCLPPLKNKLLIKCRKRDEINSLNFFFFMRLAYKKQIN